MPKLLLVIFQQTSCRLLLQHLGYDLWTLKLKWSIFNCRSLSIFDCRSLSILTLYSTLSDFSEVLQLSMRDEPGIWENKSWFLKSYFFWEKKKKTIFGRESLFGSHVPQPLLLHRDTIDGIAPVCRGLHVALRDLCKRKSQSSIKLFTYMSAPLA